LAMRISLLPDCGGTTVTGGIHSVLCMKGVNP
jgi:hypothetical protein